MDNRRSGSDDTGLLSAENNLCGGSHGGRDDTGFCEEFDRTSR